MNNNLVSLNIIKKKLNTLPEEIKNKISDFGYSIAKNKKYYVIYDDHKINYGDKRYEDYLIHKDNIRRLKYKNRHKNDPYNDPSKPAYWSWYILW